MDLQGSPKIVVNASQGKGVVDETALPGVNKTNNEVCMNVPFDQLFTWLKDHKITEVECVVSDLTGIARGKIAPTNKFLHERGMRLPESVLLQTVTGDFVDDDIYYDLLDPADIDMVCKPDADAVYVVPWAIEPTAIVIHDTFDKFGNPIELSPRNVLKKSCGCTPTKAGGRLLRRKWSST